MAVKYIGCTTPKYLKVGHVADATGLLGKPRGFKYIGGAQCRWDDATWSNTRRHRAQHMLEWRSGDEDSVAWCMAIL